LAPCRGWSILIEDLFTLRMGFVAQLLLVGGAYRGIRVLSEESGPGS
jgi:hypothetical protein